MKINDVKVPQPATKKPAYGSVLKSQQQLRDETGGSPLKRLIGTWGPTPSPGPEDVSHRAGSHLSTSPILCFLIPSLTLSSCPSLMERIDQSGSCCSSTGSGRKTCQNLTKQQGNMSRFGLGVAQAASEEHWLCKAGLPLACWQPCVISPAILPISSFCLALPVTQSIKWASYFITNLS